MESAAPSKPEAQVWRRLLLALCVVGAAWVATTAIDNFGLNGRPWFGWWDSYRSSAGVPFAMVFQPPRAGGATAAAGIRGGDIADMRDQDYLGRVTLLTQPISTESIPLKIRRGSQTISVSVVGSTVWEGEPIWKFMGAIGTIISGAWFLACAFLIAQRCAGSRDGRTLALALLGLVPAFLPQEAPVFPYPSLTMLAWTLTLYFGLAALALVTWLASSYGVRSWPRTLLETIAYALLAFTAWREAAIWIGAATLRIDPVPYYWGTAASTATVIAAALAVLLASIAAVRSVEASERSRAGWLLLPLPAAVLGSTITFFGPGTTSWFLGLTFTITGTAALLAGALAVTYALLRRRVIDVGFVLSRTLAVAGVSLVVVVAFVLLEWVLGTIVADASHATGVAANAALALVLGLSLRYIHARVDRIVDTVFFRKRYEDEQAIATFSQDAPYITDAATLLERARAILRTRTDASFVEVLVQDESSSFGRVDENDPAIVRMRATGAVLDIHQVNSALQGDLAFPMVARGRLIGAIVLGERRSGEAYAPDERAAIAHMAQSVGASLDALSRNDGGSAAELRDRLNAGFTMLAEKIDALREGSRLLTIGEGEIRTHETR